MPNRIRATVNSMQPAGAQPMLDRGRRDTQIHELPMRNNAVLAGSNLGHQAVP